MRKIQISSIFFILICLENCVPYINYIPIESEFYTTSKEKIVLTENNFDLEIWGKCGRPDMYVQFSKFYVKIKNKLDTLKLFPVELKLFTLNDSLPFKLVYSSYDIDIFDKQSLLPEEDYLFKLEYVLVDSSLLSPEDIINGVYLRIDGLYEDGKKTKNKIFKFSANLDI